MASLNLGKYFQPSPSALEGKLAKIEEKVQHMTQLLVDIERALRMLHNPNQAESTTTQPNHNAIYQRMHFINFKTLPLSEKIAQSQCLVTILSEYGLRVTSIQTNLSISPVYDFSAHKIPYSIDLLVLCTSVKTDENIALIVKCLEQNKQEELESFDSTEHLDAIENYFLYVLPSYRLVYGLGLHACNASQVKVLPTHYIVFVVEDDGVRQMGHSEIFSPAHNRGGVLHDLAVRKAFNPELHNKGVHFEILTECLGELGYRVDSIKMRTLAKRKQKVTIFDAIIRAQRLSDRSHFVFAVKIFARLRVQSLYAFRAEVDEYQKQIFKTLRKEKGKNYLSTNRNVRMIPVVLYRDTLHHYVSEVLSDNKILPLLYDPHTKFVWPNQKFVDFALTF